nr:hypothetical protein [Trichocoleus sp. FACHB-262]
MLQLLNELLYLAVPVAKPLSRPNPVNAPAKFLQNQLPKAIAIADGWMSVISYSITLNTQEKSILLVVSYC